MKHLFAFLFFVLAGHSQAQNCSIVHLGDATDSLLYAYVDAAPDGKVYTVALAPYGSYNLSYDAVVHCRTYDGTLLWKRLLSTTDPAHNLFPTGVLALADGCIVLAMWCAPDSVNPDKFTHCQMAAIRVNSAGTQEWSRLYQNAFTATEEESFVIREHPAGGFVLLSYNQHKGVMVTRLDANGIPQWNRDIEFSAGPGEDRPLDLFVDTSGTVHVIGYTFLTPSSKFWTAGVDPSGGLLYFAAFDVGDWRPYAAGRTSDGTLLALYRNGPGPNAASVKVDDLGGLQWAWSFDQPQGQGPAFDIAGGANGDVLAVIRPVLDSLTLVRMDATGAPLAAWSAAQEPPFISTASRVFKGVMALEGDTLAMVSEHRPAVGVVYPRMVKSHDGIDFSCGMTPAPIPTVSALSVTPVAAQPVFSVDSMKTWYFQISDPPPSGVDIAAEVVSPIQRLGFPFPLWAFVSGEGLDQGGSITATLTVDPAMVIDSFSPPSGTQVGNTVTWTGLPALGLLDHHRLELQVSIPAIPGLLGQQTSNMLVVVQDSAEVSLLNNTFDLRSVIVAGWDPNDKLVLPEQVYDPLMDSLLHYTIRFQNTGTDTAFNVVVVDTLPAEVSVSSFRMGSSTHACTYQITAQGVLTFTFNNILLPDSGTNEPASHGLVTFTVRPDNGLALGTTISNEAGIYFDFNPPVITPPAEVVYGIVNAVPEEVAGEGLGLYPVPVREALTVVLPPGHAAQEVLVYTADGRLLERRGGQLSGGSVQVDVQHLPQGLYLLQVVDREGRRLVARFLKE